MRVFKGKIGDFFEIANVGDFVIEYLENSNENIFCKYIILNKEIDNFVDVYIIWHINGLTGFSTWKIWQIVQITAIFKAF